MKMFATIIAALILSIPACSQTTQQSNGDNSPNVSDVKGSLNMAPSTPQATPPVTKDDKGIPVVPEKLRGDLFKAQSELNFAAAMVEKNKSDLPNLLQDQQKKQAVFQEKVNEFITYCGKDFAIGADKDNNPICTAKPEKADLPVGMRHPQPKPSAPSTPAPAPAK